MSAPTPVVGPVPQDSPLTSQDCSNAEIARLEPVSPPYITQKLSLLYSKLGIGKNTCSSTLDPRMPLAVAYDCVLGTRGDNGQ